MSLTWSGSRPSSGASRFDASCIDPDARLSRVARSASHVALAGLVLVAVALTAATAALLAGGVRLATTHGTSMLPTVHTGDMAVVRPAGEYRVGDVVAYRSAVLHTAVLHRIVAIDDGTFTLKGDNNRTVDSEFVTKRQIIGRA